MAPKLSQLSVDSEDAQELLAGIESGDVPLDWTAQTHKKQRTELGRALCQYTTASINTVLGNYRRKTKSTSGKILDLY